MAKFSWIDISKEDVIKAIEKFINENPEYPEPRSTFLIYNGKKLPAKHIRGMAYTVHYGVEISKNDFGGGMETVRFFERLGFTMEYKGKTLENIKKPVVTTVISEPVIVKDSVPNKKQEKVDGSEKIVISSKRVIEQKNALQLILNKMFDGDVVCEKTYSWLKTPEKMEGEYQALYHALTLYRGDTAFAKKNVMLRCDFVIEGQKLIIEYDERQHFSEARKVSLESYRGVPVCFDRNLWMKACEDIGAKDNSPQNRDEIRAYYDSTRDIECYKHGYRLVRIMHGQIDFEKPDALEKLKELIPEMPSVAAEVQRDASCDGKTLKVCMYLQTEEKKNKHDFDVAMEIIKRSDVDLVVFPEFCYVPGIETFDDVDIAEQADIDVAFDMCLKLSESIGKAVVVNGEDCYGSICSLFANAYADETETQCSCYIKHTMTKCSLFEFTNYQDLIKNGYFEPILYKGFKLGMTICYDCNHAIFSRMYELSGGVDLIVNSTGGDVIYDKWYKYNRARAIENSCYTLVTMGGCAQKNYVYGFNANGGAIKPVNLNGSSEVNDVSGGLYVYEVAKNCGAGEDDDSNLVETVNKKWQFEVPVGNTEAILKQSEKIIDSVYKIRSGNNDVILCLVDGMDIMKPEKVLPLLYAPELKQYKNKKYIIINRYGHIDPEMFRQKLSTVLKVRSMENFCAVILESENINKCFQCGKNRTAQVVKATNGFFGIDLDRTTGPEAIWKNKQGMKASWRENFEWLVEYAAKQG